MHRYILIGLFLAMSSFSIAATDEPKHSVVSKEGDFEIRRYQSMIIAEVVVNGDMGNASSKGFRPLAGFIFGDNQAVKEIEMTAPVTRAQSTKIEMTAPVTRVENTERNDGSWTVAFVMPESWTMETLPKPNNKDISIREVPERLVASIQFSGRGNEKAHRKNQTKLEQWIKDQGYQIAGQIQYAGYDAPWVPWPLRRNEVMIEVAMK
ncbi:MAG: hypothetical protein ACI9FR_002610 [Cryomorphaceae bacterium]|jgi:hypothetical protein